MELELAFNVFTSVYFIVEPLWMGVEGIDKVVTCFVEGSEQRVSEGEMKIYNECFLSSWVLNNLNVLPILNFKII